MAMRDVEAERLAAELLAPLGRRRQHAHAVGVSARALVRRIPNVDASLLVPAAFLHDIGYAPALVDTGFHPVDGARWLRSLGEMRLAGLVAHHSAAAYEAAERGLQKSLEEFPEERSMEADVLTYCDMTTGPSGEAMTFEQRVKEIKDRYGPGDPVTRALEAAMSQLEATVTRVAETLRVPEIS
jgi:HD superfamily phosphodiesterase